MSASEKPSNCGDPVPWLMLTAVTCNVGMPLFRPQGGQILCQLYKEAKIDIN